MLFVLCFEASILDTVYCAIRRTMYDIAVSSWRHDSWLLTNEIREDRVVVRAEVDSRGILWLFLIIDIRGHSDYAYLGNMHILRLLDYAYFGNMHIWEWRDYAYCGNMHIWELLDYAYRLNMHIWRISVWLFELCSYCVLCMKYWFCSCVLHWVVEYDYVNRV